jgi:hypothetical protein
MMSYLWYVGVIVLRYHVVPNIRNQQSCHIYDVYKAKQLNSSFLKLYNLLWCNNIVNKGLHSEANSSQEPCISLTPALCFANS